ncbi:MAG: hypothetical protein M1828_005746 [Chrysothrix sp. TS-e1954]|nr:MAG: hypothetical protein M1828_005746 [Chrysothrix sp. TS-e1954]
MAAQAAAERPLLQQRPSRSRGSGSDERRYQNLQQPSYTESSKYHQRFVLSDPVAFSYLEEDPSTQVLERSRRLEGFQSYLVEQWACSRTHPTFVISAYTGDPSHVIKVGVLSVPADEESWSPRLRMYFKSLVQYHARRRETSLGVLMTTNLSGFPSSLTLILIPGGDAPKYRQDFFVNENLKRLGCSGRVGLTLAEPNAAARAKFHQLYRTSERVDFYKSVIELVKLCQVALILFGELEPEYADGLLCDVTEKAINGWWIEVGTDFYNIERNDGIMGPTTVSALLGLLMGARNRLAVLGAPITKDVFDVHSTKRAIMYLQKHQGLHRTRRLDRKTLDRLHKVTAKQASGDGWAVPRAVKSTVAELSGKGGEMVMDIVGARDKASLAEIETIDIDHFMHLVKGERAKWLWQGKPRSRTTRDLFNEATEDGSVHPADIPTSRKDVKINEDEQRQTEEKRSPMPMKELQTPVQGTTASMKDDALARKTVLKRAKGRIKHAVGKNEDHLGSGDTYTSSYPRANFSAETIQSHQADSFPSPPASPYGQSDFFGSEVTKLQTSTLNKHLVQVAPTFTNKLTETPIGSQPRIRRASSTPTDEKDPEPNAARDLDSAPTTATQSVADDIDQAGIVHEGTRLQEDPRPAKNVGPLLRRTRSSSFLHTRDETRDQDTGWPRHLSFSAAEDSVLRHSYDLLFSTHTDALDMARGESLSVSQHMGSLDTLARVDSEQNIDPLLSISSPPPLSSLQDGKALATHARHLRERLADLGLSVADPTSVHLHTVSRNLDILTQDAEQLSSLLEPQRRTFQTLTVQSKDVVDSERGRLIEGVKELETLGSRLDYEIGGLEGRVSDVEDAVREFERQVAYTEERVNDLTKGRGKHRSPLSNKEHSQPASSSDIPKSSVANDRGWRDLIKSLLTSN